MKLTDFKIEGFKLTNFSKLFYAKFLEEDILSSAAQVAFYFSFALFPLLLFLLSLVGLVLGSADDLRSELFNYLRQIMPGSAYDLLQKTILEVAENSSGGKLSFGLLIALWSASAGIDSIRIGLNSLFNLEETRPYWKTKLTSLLQTLVIAILISIALGFVFYGWKFASLALGGMGLPIPSPFFLVVIQVVSVLVLLMLVFALIYNFSPDYKPRQWVWVTPGATAGIVLWLLFSIGFRVYLHYFNSYNKTYGSLGAVMILLLWLFLTAFVILVGGLINATLQEMSDPKAAAAGAKGVGGNKEKNKEENKGEKADTKTVETTADKASQIRADLEADKTSPSSQTSDKNSNKEKTSLESSETDAEKKSWANVAAGGVLAFFVKLFFKKKQ